MGAIGSGLKAYVHWPEWRDTRGKTTIAVSAEDDWTFQYVWRIVDRVIKEDPRHELRQEEFRTDHSDTYLVHIHCAEFTPTTRWSSVIQQLNDQRIRDPSLPWIFCAVPENDLVIPTPSRRLLDWAYSRDPSVYNIPLVKATAQTASPAYIGAKLQLTTWIHELYTDGKLLLPPPH